MTVLRVGVLGLGSVFWQQYRGMLDSLARERRIELVAGFDPDPAKREALTRITGADGTTSDAEALIARDEIDVVLVLTGMGEHGRLALHALSAGKHVLVEKPMATSLEEAAQLVALSRKSPVRLVCAPHVALSPTYREIHRRIHTGVIGSVVLARARYGWSGPSWGKWFYERDGGCLFDLGVYNVTSLCGLVGRVQRVTALVGTAIPERIVAGESIRVRSDDNAHLLLDFGHSRFGAVTTGFTMQQCRSPAIELYGSDGVLQMLGDDWAPAGFEQWRNESGSWELFPEPDPAWRWTEGLRHLVDCIESGRPTLTRPEHAYHVLEVMLAAKRSAAEGRVIEIESDFPPLDYTPLGRSDGGDRLIDDPPEAPERRPAASADG